MIMIGRLPQSMMIQESDHSLGGHPNISQFHLFDGIHLHLHILNLNLRIDLLRQLVELFRLVVRHALLHLMRPLYWLDQ
jgi:hypothetical protein